MGVALSLDTGPVSTPAIIFSDIGCYSSIRSYTVIPVSGLLGPVGSLHLLVAFVAVVDSAARRTPRTGRYGLRGACQRPTGMCLPTGPRPLGRRRHNSHGGYWDRRAQAHPHRGNH